MTERNDIDAGKILLIGSLGVIATVVVSLIAVVSYFAVDDRVEQSRSDQAAVRIREKVDAIDAGDPVAQPWLNPELQRATQQTQLEQYAVRETTEEDGTKRVSYAIPIEQAMESVLKEAEKATPADSEPKEAES